MTTQIKFLRGKSFMASASALLLAGGLSVAQAQQAADHGGVDHSSHDGANAPMQWADPVKGQSGAAEPGKVDAGKSEAAKSEAGQPAPANQGGMKHDGMGGMMGGGMGGMKHDGMSGMMGGGMMGGMPAGGMGRGGGMDHGGAGGGMMGGAGGMRAMMKHMMCGFTEHLEGRLAYLKAELRLTDQQTAAWNTFADAYRAAAQKASAKCAATDDRPDHSKPAVLNKLSMMESHMVDHLDIVRAQKAAIEPLFNMLSDEQKKIASEALTSIMKVGMSMGGGMGGGMGGMMGGMSHGGGMGGAMSHGGGGMGGMQH